MAGYVLDDREHARAPQPVHGRSTERRHDAGVAGKGAIADDGMAFFHCQVEHRRTVHIDPEAREIAAQQGMPDPHRLARTGEIARRQ